MSAGSADAVAVVEGITYHYPGRDAPALDGVSLSIRGGLTLVTGASGSGKSTLLRLLNGLVPHHHGGRIGGRGTVAGLPIPATATRELARRVAFVFQDPEAQFVHAQVEREVGFGLENIATPAAEVRARVAEALEQLGILHLRGRRVGTLSGGERQRVALASALAMRPALVALDEPASQLDREGAADLVAACADLVAGGTAMVVAEHHPDRFTAIPADRVMVDGGRCRPAPPAVAPAVPAMPARPRAASTGGAQAWRFSDVRYSFNGDPAVLDGLSLDGRAGEVVALTGANGSGKTTALRLLAGLIKPAGGSVDRTPGRVAYLPQDPTSMLHQPTVADEVRLTLRLAGSTDSPDAILKALGLDAVAGSYPRDISTGQRQRAALAAILVGNPRLALLDEPTRGMDGGARGDLVGLIRRLAEGGTAVVIATHDAELVARAADRVVDIADGGTVKAGGPRQWA